MHHIVRRKAVDKLVNLCLQPLNIRILRWCVQFLEMMYYTTDYLGETLTEYKERR
jgi:hypothetical protein